MAVIRNSRKTEFVNSMVDRVFAEADRADADPIDVFEAVREAFNNKWRCFELAKRSGTHDVNLRQFYDPRVLADTAVNCKCYALGVWGAAVEPKKIVYSGNRTIVFWNDDTKTIVKLRDGDAFDEYLGFIAAYAKKMFGSTHKLKKFIKTISSYNKPKKAKKSDATEN